MSPIDITKGPIPTAHILKCGARRRRTAFSHFFFSWGSLTRQRQLVNIGSLFSHSRQYLLGNKIERSTTSFYTENTANDIWIFFYLFFFTWNIKHSTRRMRLGPDMFGWRLQGKITTLIAWCLGLKMVVVVGWQYDLNGKYLTIKSQSRLGFPPPKTSGWKKRIPCRLSQRLHLPARRWPPTLPLDSHLCGRAHTVSSFSRPPI